VKILCSNDQRSLKLQPNCQYHWIELGFWTQWLPEHSSVLLCAIKDTESCCNASVQALIIEGLSKTQVSLTASLPFVWHAYLLERIIVPCFDCSVWKCRDLIRRQEKKRPTIENHLTDYEELHEAARHVIHSTETIGMGIEVISSVLQELDTFCEDYHQKSTKDRADHQLTTEYKPTTADYRAVLRSLRCQKTLLQCLHGRSQALENRVREEIGLVQSI